MGQEQDTHVERGEEQLVEKKLFRHGAGDSHR